jgi:endonuclease YncB( thermonuclease family)
MARPPRDRWPKPRSKRSGDNVVRFRKPSRWTRPEDYGHKPARFRPRKRALTWRQAWFEMRPWIFLIALVTLSVIYQTPAFYEPPGWLQSDATRVEGGFTRCGPGRGAMCVIDGDTFKIGETKYRVTGIDTAEVHARCPAEAAQAEASTTALQGWLSAGAFQITTRLDQPTDRYGRTLAIVKRVRADGSEERLADWMQAHGGARGYDGGLRGGWC